MTTSELKRILDAQTKNRLFEAGARAIARYMITHWSRTEIVEFCLRMLGDEARAWWNRREEHSA